MKFPDICTPFHNHFYKPKILQRYFLLLLFIFCFPDLFAQAYTMEDSVRIYRLLDQSDLYDTKGNLDSALQIASEALQSSRNKKMLRGEGFALLKIADLQLKKEGTLRISQVYKEPVEIGKILKDSLMLGLCYHQQGQYFRDQSEFKKADSLYSMAALFYAALRESNYLAIVYNDWGFIADRSGDYEKAVQLYLKAIRYFDQEGNEKEKANTLGNLGISYYKTGNKVEAIRIFKVSSRIREKICDIKGLAAIYGNLVTAYIAISQIDSALLYQQKAIQFAEKSGIKNTIAQQYANAALLSGRQNKYQDAIKFDKLALALYLEVGDKIKEANRYISLASWYEQTNDSLQVTMCFNKALEIARGLNNKPLFQNIYAARSNYYNHIGNGNQSLEMFKLYSAYKDSLVNDKNLANIEELKARYESEKKDNEIQRLETDRKIKQLELDKQKALVARKIKDVRLNQIQIELLKQQQQLRDADLEKKRIELENQAQIYKNSQQKLKIAENEQRLGANQLEKERLIRNTLLGGLLLFSLLGILLFNRYQLRKRIQEQTRLSQIRNKISKDLHDEIGSTLTSIHILSKVTREMIGEKSKQAIPLLDDISRQSKVVQQHMSDIVWAIRPDQDNLEDLCARMREYLAFTLEPMQVETFFDVESCYLDQIIPMEYRKDILLIFKEAINNIVKHAQASTVNVKLEMPEHIFILTITDNGSWKPKTGSTGTGTYSMRQRANDLGGNLTIQGTTQGTSIHLELPIT